MRLFKWALWLPGMSQLFHFNGEETTIDGLTFKNKVGMAAGFDKDGKFLEQLYALNFGFIEVGTVTPRPQSGNPKPRLFRLRQDHALINRMGFNNEGVNALKVRLQRFRKKHRGCDMQIGLNIGKNKLTPNQNAADDYLLCYEALYELGDFFIVNVSSPNTPNLRELQQKAALDGILSPLLAYRAQQEIKKPLYLKIAPDMAFEHLNQIIDLQEEIGFEGIVATNTSVDRSLIQFTSARQLNDIGDGGLSGAPVFEVSNTFVSHIRQRSKMTIIGVGGIETAQQAKEKMEKGADLVEVYTGFIYSGPGLVKAIGKYDHLQAPSK
jgi:dihydroorotate dehydrogenase